MPITEGGKFSPEDRIVSPGVFTRENDLSGIAQGVADIGAAIVAPFPQGPGFSPTLITSTADLESKFGVADGVYYGPYTAKEYLKNKGFVTVVRVGALTGYNQKNPFILWAEPGTWNRSGSAGALNNGSSYVVYDGTSATSLSNTFVYTTGSNSGVNSGSLVINSGSAFYGTFQSGVGDDTNLSVTSTSGSALYYGKTFAFTFPNNVTITGSQSLYVSSSLQGSTASNAVKLYQALLETGNGSGSAISGAFSSSNYSVSITNTDNGLPTSALFLISGSITASRASNSCGVQFLLNGVVSGSFGKITGQFTTAFSQSNDPCNPVSSSRYPLVLAVLSDTQHATLDSNFNAPGFSGSSLITASASSGTYQGGFDFDNLNYRLQLASNGSTVGTYDFSINPASSKYISNVFGTNPTAGNPATQVAGTKIEAAYLYKFFESSLKRVASGYVTEGWRLNGNVLPNGSFSTGDMLTFTDSYSTNLNAGDSAFGLTHAITPWVMSQKISPWSPDGSSTTSTKFQLFRVHTLSDGTNTNTKYKIEISNVKLAGTVAGSNWGTFTLAVRDYSDTDKKPKYLEIFQNLSLDPTSANFIARKIGDRYSFITYAGKVIEFGTYSNLSKYIRIEMSTVSYPVNAVPYGFQAYLTPISSTATSYVPIVKYSKASIYGQAPGKYASGTVFGDNPLGADSELTALYPTASVGVSVATDTIQYFAPIPAMGAYDSNGANVDFDLGDVLGSGSAAYIATTGSLLSPATSGSIPTIYDAANESTYVKMRKFIFGFQGGFDGQSPAIPINVGSNIIAGNTQGLNCVNINSPGSIAYKQCIGALSNADQYDINLIATPGIFHSLHSYVVQLVIDMCEARGDCFYIMDNIVFPATNQTVGMIDAAVNDVSTIDSNYVGTYYPWIKILDSNLNQIVSVPPSVIMPAIYASNDNAAAEWFAPAGLNRGGITQAVQVLDRLTIAERDTLYDGRVNPIAAFPGQGICVWGQKTLQVKPSALDRINVRRLLIALKKFIASSSKFLVFEQNVAATRNRFLSIVNPYLESVQQRSGLYAFQVKMDATNNTPDLIDRNVLYGQIYLQPTKTAEFIILDFNILPTGASFGQ
jgi:Phage tail sheath protein subtilisin-like domain/Phage tail sheath C-terminal domain